MKLFVQYFNLTAKYLILIPALTVMVGCNKKTSTNEEARKKRVAAALLAKQANEQKAKEAEELKKTQEAQKKATDEAKAAAEKKAKEDAEKKTASSDDEDEGSRILSPPPSNSAGGTKTAETKSTTTSSGGADTAKSEAEKSGTTTKTTPASGGASTQQAPVIDVTTAAETKKNGDQKEAKADEASGEDTLINQSFAGELKVFKDEGKFLKSNKCELKVMKDGSYTLLEIKIGEQRRLLEVSRKWLGADKDAKFLNLDELTSASREEKKVERSSPLSAHNYKVEVDTAEQSAQIYRQYFVVKDKAVTTAKVRDYIKENMEKFRFDASFKDMEGYKDGVILTMDDHGKLKTFSYLYQEMVIGSGTDKDTTKDASIIDNTNMIYKNIIQVGCTIKGS